jgi:hypothetical protein
MLPDVLWHVQGLAGIYRQEVQVMFLTYSAAAAALTQVFKWVFYHGKDIWAVVGPFLGILIGAYIADRSTRKHWFADNKKQEYRELVTALVSAFNAMVRRIESPQNTESLQPLVEKEDLALITISDRLFIREEVARLKILSRWQKVREDFNRTGDAMELSRGARDIRSDLLDEARKLMDNPHFYNKLFRRGSS